MGSFRTVAPDARPGAKPAEACAAAAIVLLALCSISQANAQWTQTQGPLGADVWTFCYTGTQVYAGTPTGVFYSRNAGGAWVDAGLANQGVHALATDGSVVYAGTDIGVYASTNFGSTWSNASLGYTVNSLALRGSKLYAGVFGRGVLLSSDGASSWTSISAYLPDSSVSALLAFGSRLLMGTTNGFVYETTDDGSSWTDVSYDMTSVAYISTLYASGGTLYAGTNDGLWRSTDSAAHWTRIALAGIWVTGVGASSTTIYAGTPQGFYVSTNGGSSFGPSNAGLDNFRITSVAPFGSTVLVGTSNSGVWASSNAGASWAESNTGLRGQNTWSLVSTPSTGPLLLFAGGTDGVSISLDSTSWIRLNYGLPVTTVWALQLSDTTLFAATSNTGIFKGSLSDLFSVQPWTAVNNGLPSSPSVFALTRVPPSGGTNPTLYAGLYSYGVYFSTNMGASWSGANNGLPTGASIFTLASQTSGSNTYLYAGLSTKGAYRSTNNGASWVSANNGIPSTATVSVIKPIGTNLFAGTYGSGAYLSTDFGASWSAISTGLPSGRNIYAFAALGNTLYAGTADGVYTSANNGASWTLDNAGPVGVNVLSLDVRGATLYAGTSRGVVWSLAKSSPPYPSSYALAATVQFPQHTSLADFSTSDYRLVGLPGNPNVLVSSYLSGNSETKWRASWDNGGTSNFLQRYDGTAAFNFTTGRAFWLINNGPVAINATVPTATLNANSEVEIPLHSGWNLITNPFSSGVAWSNVQTYNGVTEPIFQYTGTYTTPTAFSPYTGYYFYSANAFVLKIPYGYAGTASVASAPDPAAWRVGVTASDGETTDSLVSFGVLASPARDAKAIAYHRPRQIGTAVAANFPRPDLDASFPAFAADIRPQFENMQEWRLELAAKAGTPARMGFDGLRGVPADFEVWLIDEQTGRAADLRKDSVYAFTPSLARSRFTIVVGRHGAVQARLAAALPVAFALGRNFPNPFNPSTTIPVDVPQQTLVSVKIYSLLGAEVAALHQGPLEPGRYWFTWDGNRGDGKPAATGAYLVRLQAAGKAFVSKILLLR